MSTELINDESMPEFTIDLEPDKEEKYDQVGEPLLDSERLGSKKRKKHVDTEEEIKAKAKLILKSQISAYGPKSDLKLHSKVTKKGKKSTVASRTLDEAVKEEKKRRHKPGVVASREIQRLKKSPHACFLKRQPFIAAVRVIAQDINHDVKFERRAIEVLRYNASEQISNVIGAANLVNRAEGRETLDWRGFNLLHSVRHHYPNCLGMFPLLPGSYNNWGYLIERLTQLGESYRMIMSELISKDATESVVHLRQKLVEVITARLRKANIEFITKKDELENVKQLDKLYSRYFNRKNKVRRQRAT